MDHREVLDENRMFSDFGECDSVISVGVKNFLKQVLDLIRTVRYDFLLRLFNKSLVTEIFCSSFEFRLFFLQLCMRVNFFYSKKITEWKLHVEHEIKEHAKCPHVDFKAVGLVFVDFR